MILQHRIKIFFIFSKKTMTKTNLEKKAQNRSLRKINTYKVANKLIEIDETKIDSKEKEVKDVLKDIFKKIKEEKCSIVLFDLSINASGSIMDANVGIRIKWIVDDKLNWKEKDLKWTINETISKDLTIENFRNAKISTSNDKFLYLKDIKNI